VRGFECILFLVSWYSQVSKTSTRYKKKNYALFQLCSFFSSSRAWYSKLELRACSFGVSYFSFHFCPGTTHLPPTSVPPDMHTPDSALRLLPMPMDEFAAHPTVPSCNDHGFVLRGESDSHCRNVNFGLADMQLKNLNAQMVHLHQLPGFYYYFTLVRLMKGCFDALIGRQ